MNTTNDPFTLARAIDYLVFLVLLTVFTSRAVSEALPYLKWRAGVGLAGATLLLLGGAGFAYGMWLCSLPLPWPAIRQILGTSGEAVLLYEFALACQIWWPSQTLPPASAHHGEER
jgi:hypothetical protein